VFGVLRVVVASAQSLSGRQVMEVVMVIAVVVTATQTVSTHCQSAVPRRMASCLGTQRPVPLRWPRHTAVGAPLNDKLYVSFVSCASILYSVESLLIACALCLRVSILHVAALCGHNILYVYHI